MATAKKSTVAADPKAENFARIGSRRVANALDMLRRLKNLANKAQYTYTSDQVEKIMGALEAEVAGLREAFTTDKGGKAKGSFQL